MTHYHSGSPRGVNKGIDWDKQPLGHVPDLTIAKRLNVAENAVRTQRQSRKIPAYYIARRKLFDEYAQQVEEEQYVKACITWDYIAGFFDGEGYVAGSNYGKRGCSYPCIKICFCNTNITVLEKIASFLGVSWKKGGGKSKLATKPCYQLCIYGRKILPILHQLSKRCVVKKKELDLVIAYIEKVTEQTERGRLPYYQYVYWLHEKMGFTKEQIGELYGVNRTAVSACLKRNKEK